MRRLAGRELRAKVAQRLSLDSVPEAVWRVVEHEGLVEKARTPGNRKDFGRLVRQVRSLLQELASEGEVRTLVDENEVARSRSFSRYLGRLAAETSGVRSFRDTYLAGRTVSQPEADELLASPASRYLSRSYFDEARPFLGHHSRFTGVAVHGASSRDIELRWQTAESMTVALQIQPSEDELEATNGAGQTGVIPHYRGSVTDELRKTSDDLAKHYLWPRGHATRFVLTGQTPFLPPVTTQTEGGPRHDHVNARIILTVYPWVSAKTVARVYSNAQRQLLGQENRPMRDEDLQLFDFVTDRDGGDWQQWLREWDQKQDDPRLRYGEDGLMRFKRDFQRVWQRLMFPPYSFNREPPPKQKDKP